MTGGTTDRHLWCPSLPIGTRNTHRITHSCTTFTHIHILTSPCSHAYLHTHTTTSMSACVTTFHSQRPSSKGSSSQRLLWSQPTSLHLEAALRDAGAFTWLAAASVSTCCG